MVEGTAVHVVLGVLGAAGVRGHPLPQIDAVAQVSLSSATDLAGGHAL